MAATLPAISSSFGEGRELGVEAKLCELVDEAFGPDFLRAAIEMIGTEILELCAVLEHVVDRCEEGGSDGADGLFGPHAAR